MFAGRAELAVLFLVGASFFIYLFFWRVMLGNTLRFLFGMYGVITLYWERVAVWFFLS